MKKNNAHSAILIIFILTAAWMPAETPDTLRRFYREFGVEIRDLDNGTRIESFLWGNLTVKFETFIDDRLAATTQIITPDGKKLLEVRAPRFIVPCYSDDREAFVREFFLDLFGDGKPELKLTSWSGGAYGCYRDLIYEYSEGEGENGELKNILIYDGGEGRIFKGSDWLEEGAETNRLASACLYHSDGEKNPTLIIADYGIHYLSGMTHGSTCTLILKWDGNRYRIASAEFPALMATAMLEYQDRLANLSASGSADCSIVSDLIGYISNSILAGEEKQALLWTQSNFRTTREYQDFTDAYLKGTEEAVANIKSRIRTDQSKLLRLR